MELPSTSSFTGPSSILHPAVPLLKPREVSFTSLLNDNQRRTTEEKEVNQQQISNGKGYLLSCSFSEFNVLIVASI